MAPPRCSAALILALPGATACDASALYKDNSSGVEDPVEGAAAATDTGELGLRCPPLLALPGTAAYEPDAASFSVFLTQFYMSGYLNVWADWQETADGLIAVTARGVYRLSYAEPSLIVEDTSWYTCEDGAGALVKQETSFQLFTPDATEIDTSVLREYDPPLLIMPREPAAGTSWAIDSTETISRSSAGQDSPRPPQLRKRLHETRQVAAFETVRTVYGREYEALRIDSTSGESWWYAEGLGLIATSGSSVSDLEYNMYNDRAVPPGGAPRETP